MVAKILCVAEKPSIAKAVANHLGGHAQARNIRGVQYIKNYEFDFNFSAPWGQSPAIMTCVSGHIQSNDFGSRYADWNGCNPDELFEAPIFTSVDRGEKQVIAENIARQARYAKALFIWTDCDREGEHIGKEIREIAQTHHRYIEVKRAKFSNIERAHVLHAARNPVALDERQADAVAGRIELDLRIGASFTRLQTLNLLPMIRHLQELKAISYGSCQFPTLGFVVDRYFRVKNFVPETFWKIDLFHERDGIYVNFHWKRHRLFDRMIATILFERCINARIARVSKLEKKPTSKWRPLPLTTVDLQKMGSRYLHLDSQTVMQRAEGLYQKGYISYPRTETDQFPQDMDLREIISKQRPHYNWGGYASHLLDDGAFTNPRAGGNNDQAHPPIHPVNLAQPPSLEDDRDKRVYEFVVRRFLACCSADARGETTTITLQYGPEVFSATGLLVLERNYLDVYPYDKWESSQQLPQFTVNETFVPTEARMGEGETTPPGYLTEPELISLMDANGIGTDATMAEHIAKIKERCYVMTLSRGAGTGSASENADRNANDASRGGRGRGRGRGRGGKGGTAAGQRNTGGGGNEIFIPTTLGVALIEGYDKLGFETSVSKPFLRKEMEVSMKRICEGQLAKEVFVQESIDKWREVFRRTATSLGVLKASFRKYILNEGVNPTDQNNP